MIPGQKGPLEKEMAVCSSSLAWEIPWTEEPGGLQSMDTESNTTEHTAAAATTPHQPPVPLPTPRPPTPPLATTDLCINELVIIAFKIPQ